MTVAPERYQCSKTKTEKQLLLEAQSYTLLGLKTDKGEVIQAEPQEHTGHLKCAEAPTLMYHSEVFKYSVKKLTL